MTDDFSFDEGAASAAPDSLIRLNEKLAEAVQLQEMYDQMEEDLAALKKQLNHLKTSVIPDMMAEIGMDSCTQNGWDVKLHQFVNGSLPKEPDRREKAIRYLESNGGADIIKTTLTVAFNKSQHNMALDLAAKIEDAGFAPTVVSDVHAQTLAAFAREKLGNGDEVDTEVLGLASGTVAKFSLVKEKKSRKKAQ
jgi:hypothetical protein